MEEEKLRDILKDLLETDCGFLFIEELLERLGAFEKGCNFENVYIQYYNQGRRDKGAWLLDLVKRANFDKYSKIIIKRR